MSKFEWQHLLRHLCYIRKSSSSLHRDFLQLRCFTAALLCIYCESSPTQIFINTIFLTFSSERSQAVFRRGLYPKYSSYLTDRSDDVIAREINITYVHQYPTPSTDI